MKLLANAEQNEILEDQTVETIPKSIIPLIDFDSELTLILEKRKNAPISLGSE
jgi:hypothetical protein